MISLLAFADFEGDVGGDLEWGDGGGDGVQVVGVERGRDPPKSAGSKAKL
jgi:hypothetical protein